jgi:hypothetical protein
MAMSLNVDELISDVAVEETPKERTQKGTHYLTFGSSKMTLKIDGTPEEIVLKEKGWDIVTEAFGTTSPSALTQKLIMLSQRIVENAKAQPPTPEPKEKSPKTNK